MARILPFRGKTPELGKDVFLGESATDRLGMSSFVAMTERISDMSERISRRIVKMRFSGSGIGPSRHRPPLHNLCGKNTPPPAQPFPASQPMIACLRASPQW